MTTSTPPARVFSVPAISCDHCKTAIEASVADVSGVEAVNVDVDAKTVSITGGDDADIVEAIDRAGYDVA